MPIHLGRRASLEGWVSFETDPEMRRTKQRLHERCLPCMTSLWEQLKGAPTHIAPGRALECWKVTVALPTRDDCLAWLERFEERFPQESVFGKLGKGAGGHATFAVIFHMESVTRRDQVMALAKSICDTQFPGVAPFYSRGCGIPYEQLLGSWRHWRDITPIRHPERIGEVKRNLRRSLYRA